ncbi:hypothetical protein F2Q70_00022438 [Brassica cretica]|uniref:Uncharacterized protein n=1 Tax=Brassica cretica TaxID=69181 RepID=A0A8S9GRZ8_BRACR|nr:hypothetical protein F2Q70_00022438 [Brassica cretica]
MSSIMARLARQDEVQKTTNDQLAALVVALTAPDGQTSRPQQICRRLFNTNPTTTGGDHISDDSEPNETLLADHPPVGSDLATIRELAELKLSFQQMSEKIHQVTSAAPQIESVLATAFTLYGPMMPQGCGLKENSVVCRSVDSVVSGEFLANFQLFSLVLAVLVCLVGSYVFAASRFGVSS